MKKTPESAAQAEELRAIAEQLRLLTEAVQEQNSLLRACIAVPEQQKPRLMIGLSGAVEVIDI